MVVRAYLLMTNVAPETWIGSIDQRRLLIGRTQNADIRLPSHFRQVSRRHCETWADSQNCWLSDIGSHAGTHVNGVWLREGVPVRIVDGDRIWLGGVELQIVEQISQFTENADRLPTTLALENPDEVPSELDPITAELQSKVSLQLLSATELEILQWLCRGFTRDNEIGTVLHRSPHTVRTQVSSILYKLGLHSRAELIGWVRRNQRVVPSLPTSDQS